MKKCTKCKLDKELIEFGKDSSRLDGLDARCKKCKSDWKKKDWIENKEIRSEECKEYDRTHKEIRKVYNQKRKELIPLEIRRERNTKYCKTYRENNREKFNEYQRNHSRNNLNRRISGRLSTEVNDCLSGRKNLRHWQDLVGYTLEQLKAHIETQFQPNMSWANWGRGENCWHIDHIKPQSWFDFSDESQIKACWSFSNLTCKWESDNLSKGNRFEG